MLIETSFLAALSGIDSFGGIQDFVEAHRDALEEFFEFPNGLPSHDTYQRLWDSLSSEEFQTCFSDFVSSLSKISSDVISVDGKTIRNSGKEKPIHIVSAWCVENKMVFAQEKVDEKSNEITAIPKLLKLLDLNHKVITIDAIGAQREICQQIIDSDGDYVIALKGNQGTLFEDIKTYFEGEDDDFFLINNNCDKGHGRVEQRIAFVSHDVKWLNEKHKWPGLKAIAKITSKILRKGKESIENRYYIASEKFEAGRINTIVRSHWGIENQLHWVLDVVFNEDKACISNDNAAENMNTLRKWALNTLQKAKTKPEQSIKSIMRKNAMSSKHLVSVVKRIFHA
jgi:predicted transposase YbfD/YdcC